MQKNYKTHQIFQRTVPTWRQHNSKHRERQLAPLNTRQVLLSFGWYDIWPWGKRKGYKADKQVKPRGKANDEGVAGLGAKFTGSTHTVIGLSALLMSLIVERGQVPTRHSVDTHGAADFLCMLLSACSPQVLSVQKTASGRDFEPPSQLSLHSLECPWVHTSSVYWLFFSSPGGASRAPQNYYCLEVRVLQIPGVALSWRKVGGCIYLCIATVCWDETSVQFGKWATFTSRFDDWHNVRYSPVRDRQI